MYLTKVVLNRQLRGARILLSNPQKLHAAINASFPESVEYTQETGRPLYRVENSKNDTIIYISSPLHPDVKHIIEQAGRENDVDSSVTKSYDKFLNSIQNGDIFRFRLNANPTVMINKNRIPLIKEKRLDWLNRKGDLHGFSILDSSMSNDTKVEFKHNPRKITFSYCTFDGRLQVNDNTELINAIKNGIGSQKAYGMGLLSLGKDN